MKSIELFSGAGGLALGLAQAGIEHEYLVEWDKDACATLNRNKEKGQIHAKDWKIFNGDVRDFSYQPYTEGIDFLAGGPPCQPFSQGGKHRGNLDERDMFPQAVRAVASIKPKAFLFENVKGLLRQSFSSYFNYIYLQLSYPEISKKRNETWTDHLGKLEKYHTKGRPDGLFYRVVYRLVNAADYGVPQARHRVIIVGFRNDLHKEWSFPEQTHSSESLFYSQFVTGEYWDEHKVARKDRLKLDGESEGKIARLREDPPTLPRWQTVRDALRGLPRPERDKVFKGILNHEFRGGATTYPGHTGSIVDLPAKTIKAGDHGVPGGENMLTYRNGVSRYFTTREAARIQTFPDNYEFVGSWTESMRQIGNAVPVHLAHVLGVSILSQAREDTHDPRRVRAQGTVQPA